ncbi:4-hydroxyproline epimerase [Shewanella algae]|uniref:Hydroxyproline-2-epimerase n=2 Tax=Shewanella algae TaxID=38313 RepID=A0A380BJE7_9GAMM|nr:MULTISPECIES: 4-hydroxyproline epimerase [Shewanella]MBO2569923.1 4-hydroxyproline epimerase [Shewanella algae]MBO2587106.1 4-hydroxyproline epimerase [Shewanella algae]MBO2595683.1 4-hydroxyproline epimerase [Shewanella algae]MBO2608146.1 4-hydroxyproline epimerase [Shewanella algae]MBO2629137.1 4-hydroxyproline epimerase [Shewanella algae]
MLKGTFFCIDAHTCGNPVRLVTSGHPELKGQTMSEKRQHFLSQFDWIRQALMFEPRGHDMMSGAFLYPPCSADADGSILFIETSGCLPMCGHGTIGTVTAALEAGLLTPRREGELLLDVPAGQIRIEYQRSGAKVDWVKLYNVAAYLAHADKVIDVPGLGCLKVDVAYGGNFYVIVDPQENFPGLRQWSAADILRWSPLVREAAREQLECVHPDDATVQGISHVLWTGDCLSPESNGANAVFYGDKAIDRSPCGTGTSARMAQLHAKGLLNAGDSYTHESIIGSQFIGRIEGTTRVGQFEAILPSIQGWARVTGHNSILVDDEDPYAYGFQVL